MKENIQNAQGKAIEWYNKLPASTQVIGVSGLLQSVVLSIMGNISKNNAQPSNANTADVPAVSSTMIPNVCQIIISGAKLAAIDAAVQIIAPQLPSLSTVTAYCNDKFGEESFITKSSTSIEKFSEYIGQYTESIDPKAVAIIALDVAANCLMGCSKSATLKQMLTLTACDIATVVYNEISKSYDTTEISPDSDLVSDL